MQQLSSLLWLAVPVGAAVVAWAGGKLRRQRSELRALRQASEQLRICLWASGSIYWDWDFQADRIKRITDISLHGSGPNGEMSGQKWRDEALHPEDRVIAEHNLRKHLSGESDEFLSVHRVLAADGQFIWLRSRGRVIERDATGKARRMAGVAVDITQNRLTEQQLMVTQEALLSISEGVAVMRPDGQILTMNPSFERISGLVLSDSPKLNFLALASARLAPEFLPGLLARTQDLGIWSGELWLRRANGEDFFSSCELSLIPPRPGQQANIVVVLNDLTERKRAEIEVSHLTNFDALTNLPNRMMLMGRLTRLLGQTERQRPIALAFMNIDRFTQVNESFGQGAGDELLRAVALRSAAFVGEHDLVARFGGDEFVVLLGNVVHPNDARERCHQIRQALANAISVGQAEISVSISVGLAFAPEHGDSAETLLKSAVSAMQVVKSMGGDGVHLANGSDDTHARARIMMEQQLRRALERDEFYLHFQPIWSLERASVRRFEALIRWRNAEIGIVAPDVFVPILEQTGLIAPVGEWVVRNALGHLKHWRSQGFQGGVAVNISPLQLLRSNLPELMANLLQQHDLPGSALELEITETSIMSDPEHAIAMLHQLREMGISIAIDDFGTGYSSLSYLRRLPIQKLKIDRSFITSLAHNENDRSIVDTILAMAHALKLEAVAEGVETELQLQHLRQRRCHSVQGYLISRPLDAESALAFLLAPPELAA